MTTPPPDRLLATALDAAITATEIHRKHLGRVRPGDVREKGASDFVSFVDHEAEAAIVARIRAAFPGHRILAEEGGGDDAAGGRPGGEAPDHGPSPVGGSTARSGSPVDDGMARSGATGGVALDTDSTSRGAATDGDWLWVIDPLDGTTNYLHGYPAWSVSIAAIRDGVAEVGVVASAATGETWTAVRGGGAFRNGEPIRVSGVDRLATALIGTGFPFKAPDRLPAYLRQFDRVLRRTSGIRRVGSAAMDLCYVASGYLDGFWELVLAPWDIAAGALVVREAGGVVTRVNGTEPDIESGSLLAGNPVVYAALRDMLSQDNDL